MDITRTKNADTHNRTTRKIKTDEQYGPTKQPGLNLGVREG